MNSSGPKFSASPFSELDRRFGGFIQRLARGDEQAGLAAAVASWQSRDGHVCANLPVLAETLGEEFAGGRTELRLPELKPWLAALRKSPVVGAPGEFKPLVLDGAGRLYLHRYWQYEQDLAADILRRAAGEMPEPDWAVFKSGLGRFFPEGRAGEVNLQKVACFAALRRRLCVITGGPGTGKTWTAGVLLALLLEQPGAERLRVGLAAPTGKAAARLQESLAALKPTLAVSDAVKARMPEEAATLHRLLGLREGTAKAKFDAENPLALDVVIVDEASMVDLALMAKLFAAVPAPARIVLLGDQDQLASVEAGAVLADICGEQGGNGFSASFAAECKAACGEAVSGDAAPNLGDNIVRLERSHRFQGDQAMLEASAAVNAGDGRRAFEIMRSGGTVSWRELPPAARLAEKLRPVVIEHFKPCFALKDPLEALRRFARFRILCAVRHGPFGTETVNALVERILAEEGLIRSARGNYRGQPVIVLENDYSARLFNGDLGLVREDESGNRSVVFPADDGWRAVATARLPRHETAFAMTVHKSQGSEFGSVLLLVPERDAPVLSRELIYTGLTRASRSVEIWAGEPSLRKAIARRSVRSSGLADQLRRV